jgi:hypothetical protein
MTIPTSPTIVECLISISNLVLISDDGPVELSNQDYDNLKQSLKICGMGLIKEYSFKYKAKIMSLLRSGCLPGLPLGMTLEPSINAV